METPTGSTVKNTTSSNVTSHLEEADPYYLHPNESPAIVLVTPLLNEHNHLSWSRAIEMALWSKHKIGFIDGTISPPSVDDPRFVSWKRNNTMISSWLIRSVEPRIAQSIMWFETARELWEDLNDRYGRGDHMRMSNLQMQLSSLRQGALTISDYFAQYRVLWDQIEQYRPHPHCKCAKHTDPEACELYRLVKSYRSNDQIMGFLRGLNDNYSHVCEQILMMEPLPTMSRTLFLALQQERRSTSANLPVLPNANAVPDVVQQSSTTAQVNAVGKRFWNNSNKPLCTYCNKTGHTVDKCFKKHGFPPNYRPKGGNQFQQDKVFYSSNGNGQNRSNFSNTTASILGPNTSQSDSQVLAAQFNKLCLSPQQYSGLLSLVQQAAPMSDSNVPGSSGSVNYAAASTTMSPAQGHLHMTGPGVFENDW